MLGTVGPPRVREDESGVEEHQPPNFPRQGPSSAGRAGVMVVVGPLCGSEGQLRDAGGRTRGDTRILRQERRCFVAVFVSDHAGPNNATR